MPTNIGLNRNRPAPTRQPSVRMNSGTPATRAAQNAAVRTPTPRQQQPVPRVQPLPRQPADPYATNAPYRAPKPVYSDAQFRQAQESDFQFARRAAGIATDNAIRRDRAGVDARSQANLAGTRAQASAQRALNAQQNAAADRAQQRAIAASERAQSRQAGLSREQIAANERMNSTRSAAAIAAAQQAGIGGSNIARINAEAQMEIARNNLNFQREQFLANQKRQQDLDSPIRLRTQEQNAANLQASLASRMLQQQPSTTNFRPGFSGGTAAMAGRSGGSFTTVGAPGGGGAGGATVSTVSALDLAKEASKAAAERQAAQLASTERLQTERIQLERDRPMLAANAEEDLRKKARDAALRLFNSARPGMTPTV